MVNLTSISLLILGIWAVIASIALKLQNDCINNQAEILSILQKEINDIKYPKEITCTSADSDYDIVTDCPKAAKLLRDIKLKRVDKK